MDATISVICYKSKTLANGEHPLMLRIAQNGKSTYKSLKISVAAKHWDFERNVPKPNNPNKDLIQKIILKTKLDYQQKILEKKANSEEFTASSLINEQKEEIKAKTVEEFYLSLIEDLKQKGRIGNSYAYLNSYNTLRNFNKGKKLNYTFSHIDVSFCKRFEDWMRSKGNKDTTLSYQFRTLRATYNKAIEAKIVAREKNPFIEYKLSHFNTKTIKRALSKNDILKLINANCNGQSKLRQLTHDLFSFSYLCGGISFVDIANLTRQNIVGDRLIYQRQKTHGNINLLLSKEASTIIAKYSTYQQEAEYLFPILHCKRHITPMQKSNRVHKICHQVNTELRTFAQELGITAEVTTYIARHYDLPLCLDMNSLQNFVSWQVTI